MLYFNWIVFIIHSDFFFSSFFSISFALLCSQVSCNSSTVTSSSGCDTLLSPVGSISRPKSLPSSSLCSESSTSSLSPLASHYPKAPGFEREDQVHSALSLASEILEHVDDWELCTTPMSHFYFSHSSVCCSFIFLCHAIFIFITI